MTGYNNCLTQTAFKSYVVIRELSYMMKKNISNCKLANTLRKRKRDAAVKLSLIQLPLIQDLGKQIHAALDGNKCYDTASVSHNNG